MLNPTLLAGFAVTAFVIIVVPGPSVLFVVSRAVSYGRRMALLTVAGNAVGCYLAVIAIAIGLGTIVGESALVFTIVKFVGAAYLIYLGIRAVLDRRKMAMPAVEVDAVQDRRESRRAFRAGIWVGFSNPKTFILFGSILPQFVDQSLGHVQLQMVLLGLMAVVIALATDTAWGLTAGTVRSWFAHSPRRLEMIGGTGGILMVGLGANLALTGRHD